MSNMSQKEAEAQVASWGFKHVFTWTDRPYATTQAHPTLQYSSFHRNAHYPPHSHSGLTTHLILRGSITMQYPDENHAKETLGVGARWDVDAGKRHEVWVGNSGATYVIGE